MGKVYQVSVSPHVRDSVTTDKIMKAVCLALLPSAIFGVINFGLSALVILCASVAAAVVSEYCFEKITKRPITTNDFSAVVTGLLIGMNMPPEIAIWIPILGSVFGIVVVKMLYGGLGQNFMNPALGARCFLLISFTNEMTNYSTGNGFVKQTLLPLAGEVDALSGATPLAYLKQGYSFDLKALFLGNTTGVIGETCALAILVGGIFLVCINVIDIKIPAIYLGSFALLTCIYAAVSSDITVNPVYYALCEVCAGGIMLGAWFMATDYVTSPITPKGRVIYALILGVLTWMFRMLGNSSEGVSYAIIFTNCLVPLIERYTVPRTFGIQKEKKEAAS